MESPAPRHFDYLTEYHTGLETALGLNDLVKNVEHWRCFGMEYPDGALVGCRKIVEAALRKLAKPLPDSHMRLTDVIDYAEDKGVINRKIALKCHEIRRKGNDGAHVVSVRSIDAQMSLELLDDFLRWCTVKLRLVPNGTKVDVSPKDPIFIIKPQQEVAEMARRANIAAALDGNKEIERKAQKAKSQLEANEESSESMLQQMEELVRKASAIGAIAEKSGDTETLEVQKRLFKGIEDSVKEISAKRQEISANFDQVDVDIQTILNEHDFIMRLLNGSSQATTDQHDVMAFPRGSKSVTRILQIAGCAGTGKTLCLLAKIISVVDDHGQLSLPGGRRKRALFICFNKGLSNYIQGILARYEKPLPDIDVIHYDMFVNQLVRNRPKQGYEYLAGYARDVRYPTGYQIVYSNNERYVGLLKRAQQSVAARYPRRASDYYLNSSNVEGFEWLADELQWIESRFAVEADVAKLYLEARRVGRGSKRQPSKEMRGIILEIRSEFNRLLDENSMYTIEQATKRLLSSNHLPAYDAIAIDEVQDFSLTSIRLLLRLRESSNSMVFLSGDENQKIYKRDFTWRELDEGLKGRTVTLNKNMRNTSAIRHFSDRLLGASCSHESACKMVHVVNADDRRTLDLLRRLSALSQTTALITGNRDRWESALRSARISVENAYRGDLSKPGLYLLGDLQGKGLEFDNVVVDYTKEAGEDEEAEKRIRYVHFTRARKRLYIRYKGTPPKLLNQYYKDFLE